MIEYGVKVDFQSPGSFAVVLTYHDSKFGFHPLDMSKEDRLKLIYALSHPEIEKGEIVR